MQEIYEPAEAETLLVGGPRLGHEVKLPVDAVSWVDILSAETYYRRKFARPVMNPNGPPTRGYAMEFMIWGNIPQDQWMGASADAIVSRWFELHGVNLAIEVNSMQTEPPKPQGFGELDLRGLER